MFVVVAVVNDIKRKQNSSTEKPAQLIQSEIFTTKRLNGIFVFGFLSKRSLMCDVYVNDD